jgi:hypothetical protein
MGLQHTTPYSCSGCNNLKFQPRDQLSCHKYDFSQYVQASATTVPLIMPHLLPSPSFLIHQSLVTVSFKQSAAHPIMIRMSLHMPWMHTEEWTQSSTHTPQHRMEVSGQLYAPVDLPPGEVAQYLLNGKMSGPHNERGWFGEQKTCLLLLGIELWFIGHPV